MDAKATATLSDGSKVQGRLTTDHAASSYGQPVFVGDDGQAYNWVEIANIDTATDMRSKGGSATSKRKAKSSAKNGKAPVKAGSRPRGRPKKSGK